ncbi:MAG: hypothetical protein RQ952_02385 [Thermoproteota archaeon]|nr:hypothetical protein [Thermoproteota archaeon]
MKGKLYNITRVIVREIYEKNFNNDCLLIFTINSLAKTNNNNNGYNLAIIANESIIELRINLLSTKYLIERKARAIVMRSQL